jgi:hypothetical protein
MVFAEQRPFTVADAFKQGVIITVEPVRGFLRQQIPCGTGYHYASTGGDDRVQAERLAQRLQFSFSKEGLAVLT